MYTTKLLIAEETLSDTHSSTSTSTKSQKRNNRYRKEKSTSQDGKRKFFLHKRLFIVQPEFVLQYVNVLILNDNWQITDILIKQ